MNIDVGSGENPVVGSVAIDRYGDADVKADMTELPFADESCDKVTCYHALEHVDWVGGIRAVQEFYRVLKPGGCLYIEVPDFDELWCPPRMEFIFGGQHHEGDYHKWGYTANSLRDLLGAFSQVEVTRCYSRQHYVDVLNALAQR